MIADRLADKGWCMEPAYLSPAEVAALRGEFLEARERGSFRKAGIGQGGALSQDTRRDEILWFEPAALGAAQAALWEKLEGLRREINEGLFLGLFDLEGHFAWYPPGGFYQRHVDRFQTSDLRTVSVVVYLNESWRPGDGGELAIHEGQTRHLVEPRAGTLVCFLSDRIEHEVLGATKERMSFAGWFRRRP